MRTDDGYVRLYRRVWDNPVFNSRQEAAIFAWMVSVAQWRDTAIDTRHGVVKLFQGEVIFAEREVSRHFHIPRTTLQRLVKRMIVAGMICADRGRIPGQTWAIVAVLNYKQYQGGSEVFPEGVGHDGAAPGPQAGHKRAQNKEGNTERKKEKENPSDSSPPAVDLFAPPVVRLPDLCAEAMAVWNAMAEGSGLAGARSLTDGRRAALRKRVGECGGVEGWRSALALVAASAFLCGENDRGWKADLDFILQPKSFTRLREGAYANRPRGRGAKVGAGWMLNPGAYLTPQQREGGPAVDLDGLAEAV